MLKVVEVAGCVFMAVAVASMFGNAVLARRNPQHQHRPWTRVDRIYWRLASRLTQTSLSDKHAAACPHMDTHSSALSCV